MTENHFHFLGLERLAAEHGLDMRGTVLRVATDLFCQEPRQSPAAVTRYTDLALALLQTADASTRRAVAAKLAKAQHAPEPVLRALLDDEDVTVAGPVLSHSPQLRLENLTDFVADCGPAEAAAIARRADIDAETVRALACHPNPIVVEALAENAALAIDGQSGAILVARALDEPALARLVLAHPGINPAVMAPLYLQASAEQRADIRAALELRIDQNAAPAVPVDALSALNQAVLAADRDSIASSLGRALHLDPAGVERVLEDPTGEVFALALLAAGIKRAPAINLLLIAAPWDVRTSVERIFAAADVHERTSRRVAREIVAAIAGERRSQNAVFEPHMHASTTPQRGFAARRRQPVPQSLRRPDTAIKR